jgi:hypothetical protein
MDRLVPGQCLRGCRLLAAATGRRVVPAFRASEDIRGDFPEARHVSEAGVP